jgi:hypothetical protein
VQFSDVVAAYQSVCVNGDSFTDSGLAASDWGAREFATYVHFFSAAFINQGVFPPSNLAMSASYDQYQYTGGTSPVTVISWAPPIGVRLIKEG